MKRLFIISALVTLLLSACGSSPTAAVTPTELPLPVVQVDAQHMLSPDLAYEIPAGAGFVLDASTYVFGTAEGPNAVQVVMNGRAYQTTWAAGETVQTIRAVQLTPPGGSAGLSTFTAGKQLIVAIGTASINGRFEPLWVGVVNVK